MIRTGGLSLAVVALFACGCETAPPAQPVQPPLQIDPSARDQHSSENEEDSEPALFRALDETFGRKGEVKDGVYRLVTPRDDLFVTMDGRDVPTGAFIESDFRFWRCPCGKALVNGQFVVVDYEANDVVEDLLEHDLHVATIAPLMVEDRPRLMLIRFQGEGKARELATALKSALGYTADARSEPNPFKLPPP